MSTYHATWHFTEDGYLCIAAGSIITLTPEEAERLGRELRLRQPCDLGTDEPEPPCAQGRVCAYPQCDCLQDGICRHAVVPTPVRPSAA